jgi:HK97 family phage major capsid protein
MKSIELKELRAETLGELEVIQKTAEAEENRDLTEEENTNVDVLLAKADDYASKIERAEKLEKTLRESAKISGVAIEPKADKDLEKFTFQGAMRAAYTGKVDGIYKEMDEEARSEARYTGQSFNGIAIPSSILTRLTTTTSTDVSTIQVMNFVDQLEANLVLASAGANFYSGVNSMKFPIFSAIASEWVNEAGTSPASPQTGAGTTGNLTLTPKKLISIVNMSQESMVQSAGLEAALVRNMASQVAASLEKALIGGEDVTNAPTSIFLDGTSAGTTVTAATILAAENTVLGNNVPLQGARMAYICNPDAMAIIKTLAQVSSVSAIYDNREKELNGYYTLVSSNVGHKATTYDNIMFGDFSRVHIAQFGGLDVLYDPYTNSSTGNPRMVVTGLYDGDATTNDKAFTKIITTS